METLVDVILSRRSIRHYIRKSIPEDALRIILESGRLAPSANNRQPWKFIVVTDDELKTKLSRRRWSWFIKESAFTVVGCGYRGDEEARKWSTIDTAIALQNMVLAAWSMGIGSCWVGDFDEAEVKTLLGIPEEWKVVCLVSFGYPERIPETTTKKGLSEVVSYNKF
ncbi:MAG: nitroreductase family protein [Candidatus Bathyarchaeia archaeon]